MEDYPQTYKMPTIKTDDQELVSISVAWLEESKKYHSELEKIWKQNEEYYKGKQTKLENIPSDMANTVQNHIFMGIETVVPIATSNPPQFIVEPPEESDTAVEYAKNLQSILSIQYETASIRTKGEMLVRHMLLYRLGAWKIIWDNDMNDVNVKSIRPQRLYFPKVSIKLPYMIEKVDITADEFRDVFGIDKFKKFLQQGGSDIEDEEEVRKVNGLYSIWEISTEKMIFWRSGSMIIDKRVNPFYDFEEIDNNHFESPKIPYILASAFRLGNEPVGETDLIQQCIPIQDTINTCNRLIINNANKMGNAQWFVDSEVMPEEDARTKITNRPGLIVYGQGVANPNMLRRDPPPPMPEYIANLKAMAESAFDNIFGTHSTTRGERQKQETLGGRLLLKQADYGRIDLLVREYERCVADLGNWFLQLMKLNYGQLRTFRHYGESGIEFINLLPEMIQKGIRALVKSGTTLPTDEMSKREEAIQLWSLGALDPVTLFERLKFPNAEETAQKLQAWLQGQIMMEQQAQPERSVKPGPSGKTEVAKANKGNAV